VGLRSTRIHALRHYSATELLSVGVDLRTVTGRPGHASGSATTLRFYAAWVEKVDRAAAGTIAELIPRPDPTRCTPCNP
jgi:NUDIX domain/Bacterial regulatory proteins, gntR family